MAAFAFENVNYGRYYFRLDSTLTPGDTDHAFILDSARELTASQTAIVYGFDRHELEVRAVAVRSGIGARLGATGVTFTVNASRWLERLTGPAQASPLSDPNFEKFPEALQYRLPRLLVTPLRGDSGLLGVLTLGRSEDTPFGAHEVEAAGRAGRLLAAVLERDALRQKLAERKLIERARGIVQQRRRVSEEQAYTMLRNNSRRRRIPMAHLAKEIIEECLAQAHTPRPLAAPGLQPTA